MKISKVLFMELKTRMGDVKGKNLVLIVLMRRSTSLESGLASPLEVGLFLKDSPSSTMSSVKSKSLTFSAGYRCDHQSRHCEASV